MSTLLDKTCAGIDRIVQLKEHELHAFVNASDDEKFTLFIQAIIEDVIEAGAAHLCNFESVSSERGGTVESAQVASDMSHAMREQFTKTTGIAMPPPFICRLAEERTNRTQEEPTP